MGHREQEWQFTTADLEAVREWLSGAASDGDVHVEVRATVHNVDTYYDTPDWMIHRAGYSLRIRESSFATQPAGDESDAIEITLKSLAKSPDGLAVRRELNEPLSSADVNAIASAGGDVCARVRALAGPRPLNRLFQTYTQRERFVLTPSAGGNELAEVALDQTRTVAIEDVEATGTGASEQVNRVEVECLDGPPERHEAWVEKMRTVGHLEPASVSKFHSACRPRA